MEIVSRDIKEKKTFTRAGYLYEMVQADDENHIYVFQMTPDTETRRQYEVVKGKRRRNPDGTTVYVYPKDEDFGTLGFYVVGTEGDCRRRIAQYIEYFKAMEKGL